MLNLDERTGNVLTTVALFVSVAAVVFAARSTLTVFVLALLLAYLLEPLVGTVQSWLPSRSGGRVAAIALVYLAGLLLVVGAGFSIAPAVAQEFRQLAAGAPEMRARLAESTFLAQHSAALGGAAERVAAPLLVAVEQAGWLLVVPLIAPFLLNNRQTLLDGTVDLFVHRREQASVRRTVGQIDTMLAQYTRAQLATAGLSAAFYIASMAVLKFPYPLALGIAGGALDFVPVVGWILAAAAMLTTGWLAHAHWLWMAVLIVTWRMVLNFVISPRLLGNRLQMDPIVVFFALMAGGQIAGVVGAILSVPAVAVLRILWLERSARQASAAA